MSPRMASAFHGPIDAHVAIAAPHCGPGGTMNFNLGPTAVQDSRRKCEPFSTVPFSRDTDFVDRPGILAWIRENCAGLASRAALVGLGGVGKSQLAIQYCHDVRIVSPHTWVFWVHASTRARFEEAYRSIANRLELPGRNEPHVNILTLVRDWLCDESNGQWIMVLDNADDIDVFYPARERTLDSSKGMPASLATFLPQSHNGSILVTSRSKHVAVRLVGSSKRTVQVQAMDKDQAVQLLRNKLQDASDEAGMAELIDALDCIPLAICQAAAYINQGARMTISRYLANFQKNDRKKSSLLSKDAGDLRRDDRASNSVVATWEMSFEQIRKQKPSAADLLSLMSFFNPQGIPESVLRAYTIRSTARTCDNVRNHGNGVGGDDDDDGDDDFDDNLDILLAYSLVKITVDSDVCEMHQLVQFCTREWLSYSDSAERWGSEFIALMAKEFPNGDFQNWRKCHMLLPHIEPMFKQEPVQEDVLEDWAEVLSNAAWYLLRKGEYSKAEDIVTKAVRVRKGIAGHSHLRTLMSSSVLGVVLKYQGKYELAEETGRQVLAEYEKILGKEHVHTLTSMNNLALVLHFRGKQTEAEEMIQRALDGREKALGKGHPSTLSSMSNLASFLHYRGMYEASEMMNRRALEGYTKLRGAEDPSTLTILCHIATVLQYQGKYKAAEDMNRRALEGREKALGRRHPDTLQAAGNQSTLLASQGKYEEAEKIITPVLQGHRDILGEEHPDTLTSIRKLASVLQYQGKYEAAEEMDRWVLERREKLFGKEHPTTLLCIESMARVLKNQGKYKAAEEMGRQALEGREGCLGKGHPDTLRSVSNLAGILEKLGRYDEAEAMIQQALQGQKDVLGEEHPDTLTSVVRLGAVLQNQGKYDLAEEMNRRALDGREKVLGREHPDTLTSVAKLAIVLQNQEKYEEAEEMNWRALEGREKVLGKEHHNTLASVYSLASLFHRQRQYKAALALFERAARGYQRVLGAQHPTTISCSQHYSSFIQEIQDNQ